MRGVMTKVECVDVKWMYRGQTNVMQSGQVAGMLYEVQVRAFLTKIILTW